MRLPTTIAALAALLTTAWCSAAAAESAPANTWEKIRTTQSIMVGYQFDSLPFSYSTDSEQPMGYAIDICKALLSALQKEMRLPALQIHYREVTSETRFTELTNGTIDIECASSTNTRERREVRHMAFSMPYYIAGVRMMVPATSKIDGISDANDKKIIINKGSTTGDILKAKEELTGLRFTKSECITQGECFAALQNGEVDAWVMDDITLASFRAQASTPSDFKLVGKLLSIEPLGIMMRDSDTQLKKFFDTEMRRMARSYEINAIYKTWFESPLPIKNFNLNIPMSSLLADMLRYPTDQFD